MSRLIQSRGKVTFLRVHDVGSGYGPPDDHIDVEVVAGLDSVPDRRMGFRLRDDANRAARQGMLDLLRDAFAHDWTVLIDYSIDVENDKKNGEAIRVALVKDRDRSDRGIRDRQRTRARRGSDDREDRADDPTADRERRVRDHRERRR